MICAGVYIFLIIALPFHPSPLQFELVQAQSILTGYLRTVSTRHAGNRHNAFTLGIATSEIYVMHGETAAAVSFSSMILPRIIKG